MAINDVKISELPNIADGYTDDSLLVITESGSSFNVSVQQLKDIVEFQLTSMPLVTDSELSASTELLVHTLEQSKITLEDFISYIDMNSIRDQRGSMRLATSTIQNVTDDVEPQVMNAFDTIITETSQMTCDIANNNITYTGPNVSSAIVSIGINMEFPGTEEVEIYAYINGQPYSDNPIHAQGRGAGKPIEVYWSSDIPLSTNDTIDLRVRNADVGDFDLTYLRSTFRIDINNRL